MRKLWILTALVLFISLPAGAETYSKCMKKCEAGGPDTNKVICTYCCDARMEAARNRCGLKALENLSKCQDLAKDGREKCKEAAKTDKDRTACDKLFDKALKLCDKGFAKLAAPCHNPDKDIDITNEECTKK